MEIAMKLLSKVEQNADKIGALAGYLGTFAAVAQAEGRDFWEVLKNRHLNAVAKMNFANVLDNFVPSIMEDPNWGGMVWGGTTAFIAGLIASELDIDPKISRLGRAAKKAGMSAAFMGALATFVGKLSEASGGSEPPKFSSPTRYQTNRLLGVLQS